MDGFKTSRYIAKCCPAVCAVRRAWPVKGDAGYHANYMNTLKERRFCNYDAYIIYLASPSCISNCMS